MSASRKIAILLFMAAVIYVTESGRGGGYRGGGSYSGGSYRGGSSSRYSRSSSRYYSRSSTRGSSRYYSRSSTRGSSSRTRRYYVQKSSGRYSSRLPSAYNVRGWATRTKAIGMRAGAIYVASRLHRLHYRDVSETYDDTVMSLDICRNTVRYPRLNLTQNVYGWFLCPTAGYEDEERYCCGDEDREFCCSYWKTGDGIRDIVLYSLAGVIGLIVISYFLIKNPEVLGGIFDVIMIICCCPCNYVSKRWQKWRRHYTHRREQRRRRMEAEAQLDREIAARPGNNNKDKAACPPPPSYESCVRRSLILDEIDVSCNEETSCKTADGLEGNHCDELPYPLSSHVEPSAPTAPSSTYRSPSPPTYRSPSPPTYRSPSPPTYRPSSPACGRSSPACHSFSSNHS